VSGRKLPDPPVPPYVEANEEAFLSSLGWGLQFSADAPGRWEREVSDGLGLDPSKFAHIWLRTLFVAIRDLYLDQDGFNWIALMTKLYKDDPGDERMVLRVTDIALNRFTTVGALRSYRREIEAYADGAGIGPRGGWR
jgi:hypothetical protein